MSGCTVNYTLCPQFTKLCDTWKNSGYPSIESDLAEAFQNISKDILSNHCRIVGGFSGIIGKYKLFKYRQKNSKAKEGSRGGWRIYALYDGGAGTLYPIIVYPKKEWADASEQIIKAAIKEVVGIVERKLFDPN